MRQLLVAAAVLSLTAYLTYRYPMGVEAITLNRFGVDIGKMGE
ncbi:conserved hypothetical protein [Paraburkholderia tropica]